MPHKRVNNNSQTLIYNGKPSNSCKLISAKMSIIDIGDCLETVLEGSSDKLGLYFDSQSQIVKINQFCLPQIFFKAQNLLVRFKRKFSVEKQLPPPALSSHLSII